MAKKRKERIPVKENSTPPSDSDAEPDSEAIVLRRKSFSFPKAVALLEKFLKEAEQKIEETEKLYSRPGKLLTHEEMAILDRKVLGIAAVRKRVGMKMKKLEEECWKEMEEILEGGGEENDRDEKRFSFLLTIVPPSRDASSIIEQLKMHDFSFKMEPTFESLAPFAETYAVKDEENTKVQEQENAKNVAVNTVQAASSGESTTNLLLPTGKAKKKRILSHNSETDDSEVKKEVKQEEGVVENEKDETDHQVAVNTVHLSSEDPQAIGLSRQVQRQETFGRKLTPQPKILSGKGEKRRLPRRHNKENSEIKEEVKQEEDVEMGEGGDRTAKDQSDGVEKEEKETDHQLTVNTVQPSPKNTQTNVLLSTGEVEQKRLEMSRDKEVDDSDMKKEVKQEEEDVDMEEGSAGVENEADQIDHLVAVNSVQFSSEEPQVNDLHRQVHHEETVDGNLTKSEEPSEVIVKEEEVDGGYEDTAALPPQPVDIEMDQGNEETLGEMREEPAEGESEKPVKRRKIVEEESDREEVDDQGEENDLGGGCDLNEFCDTEAPVKRKFVRRSIRQTKPVTYAMEKDSDDESSEDEGSSESDLEDCEAYRQVEPDTHSMEENDKDESSENDEDRNSESDQDEELNGKLLPKRRTASSCDTDDEQEDDEMDDTVDNDDPGDCGNDSEKKKCPIDGCSETLSSSEDLVEYMKQHVAPFICGVCKHVLPFRSELRRHYMYHNGERPFKCGVCKKGFVSSAKVKIHERVHTGERPFECTLCDYKGAQYINLTTHMRTHSEERPYECDICSYKAKNTYHLKVHRRMHTGEKPFSCSICNKRFTQSQSLVCHMRTHTGERPYECDSCGYKTSNLSHLKIHRRMHSGEKPFECDYKAAQRSDLKRHKRIHTGDYECDTCAFKTTSLLQLKIHRRTHTDKLPFECDICGYKTFVSSSFKSHKLIHTGERPYECDKCEYKTTKLTNLTRHKRTHTGEKPYSCTNCAYKATDSSALNRHKKKYAH